MNFLGVVPKCCSGKALLGGKLDGRPLRGPGSGVQGLSLLGSPGRPGASGGWERPHPLGHSGDSVRYTVAALMGVHDESPGCGGHPGLPSGG